MKTIHFGLGVTSSLPLDLLNLIVSFDGKVKLSIFKPDTQYTVCVTSINGKNTRSYVDITKYELYLIVQTLGIVLP